LSLILQVKNYHQKFYRPENLYLIITGVVEPQQVLETISAFEKKVIGKVCDDMSVDNSDYAP